MTNKQIPVESPMLRAFKEGCNGYHPVFDGVSDFETEACLYGPSLRNLRKIVKTGRRVMSLECGPNANVLVVFDKGEYLATGFAVGYAGEEVLALAEFAAETLGGSVRAWRNHLIALDQAWEGPLELPGGNGLRVHDGNGHADEDLD